MCLVHRGMDVVKCYAIAKVPFRTVPVCVCLPSSPFSPPCTADQIKWTVHQSLSVLIIPAVCFHLSPPLKYGHSSVFSFFFFFFFLIIFLDSPSQLSFQ